MFKKKHRIKLADKVLALENSKRFRGGLVFKAHSLVYHSTLGSRVIKKEERRHGNANQDWCLQTIHWCS